MKVMKSGLVKLIDKLKGEEKTPIKKNINSTGANKKGKSIEEINTSLSEELKRIKREQEEKEKQAEERRKKAEIDKFYYKIASRASLIAKKAGDCYSEEISEYESEPYKANFEIDDIKIIWDKYYNNDRIYKKEMLIIYINNINVYQYEFNGSYGKVINFFNSDWYKIIDELYERLPKLEEQKRRKKEEYRQKEKKCISFTETFKKYSVIAKSNNQHLTNLNNMLIGHELIIKKNESSGSQLCFNSKSYGNSSSLYGYTVYYKKKKVFEFPEVKEGDNIYPTPYMISQYIPGDWENFFVKDISEVFDKYIIPEKKAVEASIKKTLTNLKKM